MRPSYRELDGKLKRAMEIIEAGNLIFCEDGDEKSQKVDAELCWLEDQGHEIERIGTLIVNLIGEIRKGNVLESYRSANGGFPPITSVEPEAGGEPYWPFCWQSAIFGLSMYLKFVIVNDCYLYLSLHPSRK